MSEEKHLIPANVSPVSLFQGNKLEPFLAKVKKAVDEFTPDVESGKGRKEIAAFSYRIRQTKVMIEKAGKALVSKQKEELKLIDNDRKKSRDFLDEQRDRARQPLTLWEEVEKKALEEEENRIRFERDHTEALEYHALYLKEKELEALKGKIEREAEEKREAEEAARLEKDRIEREERLKKEAAAEAKKEAEEALAAEKEKAIRLEVEARAKAERVEQEKKDAAKKAEVARFVAEEAAKIEKETAIQKAIQEKEEAVRQEKERARIEATRIEDERIAKESAERAARDRKARHKSHQRKFNREILEGLQAIGISENESKLIIKAIATKQIPHVVIIY